MSRGTMDGAVYVQTNEPENRVVAFARAADGTLRELGRHATGGAGDGRPHLTSQGSVVLSDDGRHLLVTNVASDEVGVFRVDGTEPELIQTLGSGGAAPKSLAEREGIVYVLNTGTPSVSGFHLSDAGLAPLMDAERPLSAGNTESTPTTRCTKPRRNTGTSSTPRPGPRDSSGRLGSGRALGQLCDVCRVGAHRLGGGDLEGWAMLVDTSEGLGPSRGNSSLDHGASR